MFESLYNSLNTFTGNDMYITFATLFIFILFIYLIFDIFRWQIRDASRASQDFYHDYLEPFSNISPSKVDAEIVSKLIKKNKELKDNLLLSKYRETYENAIFAMEENINLHIIENLLSIKGTPTSELVDKVTKLQSFKASLSDSLKFIDDNDE
jgi:hypothetical protein